MVDFTANMSIWKHSLNCEKQTSVNLMFIFRIAKSFKAPSVQQRKFLNPVVNELIFFSLSVALGLFQMPNIKSISYWSTASSC